VDLPDGDPPPLDGSRPDDPALLCYTSGTTGASKGAVLAHGNLLGSFDERRYLRIEGRSKELIITGGFNVHPREVEELLLEHPGVAEVAVVGTPSEEWGEQVTAFVVPADVAVPPAREELLAFAADRLAGFKRPRLVHYVDALPRNALGKVMKHQLRA